MTENNTPTLEPNRLYRNAFFQKIYEDEERLRDTIEFLSQKEANHVQLANVKPVLLGKRENDLLALLDGIIYYLIEAQSTPNPNMPFRILNYITTALSRLVEAEDLYSKQQVKVIVPKLFTIFTGIVKEAPKNIVGQQKLSDAYIVPQEFPDLEVIVHTYQFTMTQEEVMAYLDGNHIPERLKPYGDNSLFWYGMFCNCVELKYRQYAPHQKAARVRELTSICQLFQERGIFVDVFNDEEVINMSLLEFSREGELAHYWKHEGIEEGLEQGLEKGLEIGEWNRAVSSARNFLSMGLSLKDIARGVDLPLYVVQDIAAGKEVAYDDYVL